MAVVEICKFDPAITDDVAAPAAIVIDGNGVIAKFEPPRQDEMNPAARENTERIPRGCRMQNA